MNLRVLCLQNGTRLTTDRLRRSVSCGGFPGTLRGPSKIACLSNEIPVARTNMATRLHFENCNLHLWEGVTRMIDEQWSRFWKSGFVFVNGQKCKKTGIKVPACRKFTASSSRAPRSFKGPAEKTRMTAHAWTIAWLHGKFPGCQRWQWMRKNRMTMRPTLSTTQKTSCQF